MAFSSWLRWLWRQPSVAGGARRGNPAPNRLRFTPTLEALEDRTLLNAGGLDPSFGTRGIVLSSFGWNAAAAAVAIQSDGKIVVAGTSSSIDTSDFIVARYTQDGRPDPSFGSDGQVFLSFSLGAETFAGATSLAIQPDGKIIVAGTCSSIANPAEFALARLGINGTPDPGFGTNGTVLTPFGTPGSNFRVDAAAAAVALQPDGKIVLAGSATYTWEGAIPPPGFTLFTDFAVARYDTHGQLDKHFGSGGEVVTSFGHTAPGHGSDQASGVALQNDGKIVVVGTAYGETPLPVLSGTMANNAPQNSQFALVRYNTDGSPDPTFGANGLVLTSVPHTTQSAAAGVEVAQNGTIVVAGTAGGRFALARYTSSGLLDHTFGVSGTVTTAIPGTLSSSAHGLILTSTGQIVVAGSAQQTGNRSEFALIRYDADGKLDTRFGRAGTVRTPIGSSASAFAIALQSDGKVVAAGSSWVALGGLHIALARYQGGPILTAASGIEGVALISPIFPVARPGVPDSRRLAGAVISVETVDADVEVARVVADQNGFFRLHLAPGRYRLVPLPPTPGARYPRAAAQTIVVQASKYTFVMVNYDSGIE